MCDDDNDGNLCLGPPGGVPISGVFFQQPVDTHGQPSGVFQSSIPVQANTRQRRNRVLEAMSLRAELVCHATRLCSEDDIVLAGGGWGEGALCGTYMLGVTSVKVITTVP